MTFAFKDSNDISGSLPLLIGLIGPSGGGKTLSALRLAKGIQSVRGGLIVGIDTEARRMLHYKSQYQFKYLQFGAPFTSLRYCDALLAAAKEANGGVVIVDSMSHEHEGAGGYLEYHESELDRMAGNDWKKREKCTFTAWIKPSADRTRLINTILQTDCAFIFCFRAKEKLKIMRGSEPIPLGWQAIAGDAFAYEMTVRCLLPPGANGIPDWSEDAFKNHVAKRGNQHIALVPDGAQLNEDIGAKLALWAKGEDAPSFEDWITDIKIVPSLDGLKFKYESAYKLFTDIKQRAELLAAKDARKAELTPKGEPTDVTIP